MVLVCRVGGVASGTQLSYTWTCPNGPCDVGEGNNPNRKTYGDRMVLNVLTSREEGMYTCLVREEQDAVHESSFTLAVQGVCMIHNQLKVRMCNCITVAMYVAMQEVRGVEGMGRVIANPCNNGM